MTEMNKILINILLFLFEGPDIDIKFYLDL